jgi:NAD(P)-dependent dehydrogenase (short-subunit alcohol dehydrogenase family)
MLLSGKHAIIYGGAGAVGGAVASAFARQGARVHLVGRKLEALERKAQALADEGYPATATTGDATDRDWVARHMAQTSARQGPVSIVFNAIGWSDTQGQPLAETPFAKFFRPIELAMASWHAVGSEAALHMGQHGGGVILGITANAARQPMGAMGGFGIACAAVEHFLKQLAVEVGPKGIRCCWVRSPGSPDAPGVREAWALHGERYGMTFEDVHREFAKDVPLRRISSLSQVADAAVLLASDLASGMTATVANATGGGQID